MGQKASRRSLPPAEEVEEAPYELRSIRCSETLQPDAAHPYQCHKPKLSNNNGKLQRVMDAKLISNPWLG